jgi:hypothetical protein
MRCSCLPLLLTLNLELFEAETEQHKPPGQTFQFRPDFYGLSLHFLLIFDFEMSNFVASGEIFRQYHAQKSCGGRHDFTGIVG